jgi:glycerol-3-phosphate acyltransferase PlsY
LDLRELLCNLNLGKGENNLKEYIAIIIICYFIGNFSSAYILGKVSRNMDIREYGSGNAGATNALRVFGIKIGIISFILDILKGFLATYIGSKIGGHNGALIGGVSVVIGHDWPVILKFKGGKGIASSLGVMLFLSWPTTLICSGIGFVIIAITKYVSLGSIVATCLVPIVSSIIIRPYSVTFFLTTLVIALLAVIRHKDNINRLIKGEELKLGQRVN